MFMGVVATGDKTWGPSSGTLRRKKMRYQLHVLKIEGRNPQSKLEGMQDCLVK
ncbi:hypothetical protein Godav_013778 [Gossypium davidsonii]|uniref:Uncharacterized protein n=2 Tax=Gossypium TaxID=3633 RepID=A0A7J8RIC0_GOSDV|nr:hypothetical protein [Gossypium davidsonii]MBA0648518.1 hypothetical protein [Gossypium klotzschianum]